MDDMIAEWVDDIPMWGRKHFNFFFCGDMSVKNRKKNLKIYTPVLRKISRSFTGHLTIRKNGLYILCYLLGRWRRRRWCGRRWWGLKEHPSCLSVGTTSCTFDNSLLGRHVFT
tara:strand:+ start:184 stop:522 length:339 start_codon:yes stop_codon:yes gene_type:complete